MSVLLIRNSRTRRSTYNSRLILLGAPDLPLDVSGQKESVRLGETMRARGFDPGKINVAVSPDLRSRQTAEFAGFIRQVVRPLLREVNLLDDEAPEDGYMMTVTGTELPSACIESAEKLLANPPDESIWFADPLVIASLRQIRGLGWGSDSIPRYGEIIEIHL